MGSRTVWKIATSEDTAIHLYSHWGGEDKLQDTANALLEAESRWDDRTYFTRIFVSQIIKHYWNEETGHGLWAGDINEQYFEESYQPVTIYPIDNTIEWDGVPYTFRGFTEMAKKFYGVGA